MAKDNIECVFPNVVISLRIFITIMVTNCAAERSFSQLRHIKNPNRTKLRQEKLDSLCRLMIEAELLRKINFDDIYLEKRTLKCKCMSSDVYER